MNVTFNTTVLAPGGVMAAAEVKVNGRQIVDEQAFFRAAASAFYPRANLQVEFSFVTKWIFNTTLAAEMFVLLLPTASPMTLADRAVLQCVCGTAPNTQIVYMNNAVLEAVQVVRYIGLSVEVAYTLKGPGFQTDAPPDTPPVIPPPSTGTLVYQRGLVPVLANATSIAVVFNTPFATPPVVDVCGNLAAVSGSTNIACRLVANSVTITGFTAEFGAATPDSTYFLTYFALQ